MIAIEKELEYLRNGRYSLLSEESVSALVPEAAQCFTPEEKRKWNKASHQVRLSWAGAWEMWEVMGEKWPDPPEEPRLYRPQYNPGEGFGEMCHIPESSGVYFLWASIYDVIVYVGQAIDLKRRITGHYHRSGAPYVAWIEIPLVLLDWAEAYYIGQLMPPLNFGNRAKWRTHSSIEGCIAGRGDKR